MDKETLPGQAEIWKFMFSHVDSMALKSAVKLHIADIIHSHGRPITLREMISCIGSPSPDSTVLARIMRLLVRRNIFAAYPQSDGGETLYGLTPSSRWILQDAELSLAPMILLVNDERTMAPYHYLSECMREGGNGFEKAHEVDFWAYGAKNPSYSKLFNDGMECSSKIILTAIMEGYTNGFEYLGSVVAEVGVGLQWRRLLRHTPILRRVLHDWSDADCIRILKNCRRSISKESGKVIIVESVLDAEGECMFDDTGVVLDIVMLALTVGGKERTKHEWDNLLNEGGKAQNQFLS